MKTHKDLNVWQESIALLTIIYEKTKSFPKDELFALTSQINRLQFQFHQILLSCEIGYKMEGYFVYVLRSKFDGKFYTGFTTDITKRLDGT